MEEITLFIAFIGGLFSFFSPCILPLIPAYLSYLSGARFSSIKKRTFNPDVFVHSVLFCMGFTLVFVLLGTILGGLGNALPRLLISKGGGILIIVFGLHTIGLLRIPFLSQEHKIDTKKLPKAKYFTSLLIGGAFGVGWSPCVSAILASILVLAANEGSVVMGSYLLLAFSLGLTLPFLMTGLFTGFMSKFLLRFQRVARFVNIFAGLMLILLGIAVYTQTLARIIGLIL